VGSTSGEDKDFKGRDRRPVECHFAIMVTAVRPSSSTQMDEYVWSAARLQEKSWDREDKSAQMYSAF